jgi:tripartite ATP-independent transporter DctP family solute receptor
MKQTKIIVVLLSVLLLLMGVQGLWAAGTQETGADKVYEIKIGHANIPADNSALHVTGMVFEELVEEYSGGRIQAEIYPSGQLGSDAEMADLVVSGAQEVLVTSLNLITQYAPRFRAFLLPYMFENNENFRKARAALWDEFNDYLIERANMRLITLWDSGYRHVMSNKPVYTLEDLKKLKFRVPPSPVMIEMVKSWGVSPTPVEWSEVFNALQLGVIDAIEVDDSVLISARMNEVVDYITNDDHILQVSVAVMSQDFYEKLPPDLQEAVDRAAKDSIPRVDARSAGILEEAVEVSKKEQGVQFLGRPKDYEVWAEKARTSWNKFYGDIGGGDEALGKEIVAKIFAAAE